jgi:hypothetical protein
MGHISESKRGVDGAAGDKNECVQCTRLFGSEREVCASAQLARSEPSLTAGRPSNSEGLGSHSGDDMLA